MFQIKKMSIDYDRLVKVKKLRDLYNDPGSDLFLLKNSRRLLKKAREQPGLYDCSLDDIAAFKQSQQSILHSIHEKRPKQRYARYRPYKSFSTHHILYSDLMFIPSIGSWHFIHCYFLIIPYFSDPTHTVKKIVTNSWYFFQTNGIESLIQLYYWCRILSQDL